MGLGSGGEDNEVAQVIADLVAEPEQVPYVLVPHRTGELHLEAEDSGIPLDDEVDLVPPVLLA